MEELRRLYAWGRAHRKRFWAGVACALVLSLFGVVAGTVIELIGKVLRGAQGKEAGELTLELALVVLLLPVLALLKGALAYCATYLIAHAAQGVLTDLRAAIYRSLVERRVGELARTAPAELVSRVTNDVARIETGLTLRLTDLIVHVPTAVLLGVYLCWLNWRLAVVATLLMPVAGLLIRRWARRLKVASLDAQAQTGSLSSVLNESISGIRVVKAYLAEGEEVRRFDRFNGALRASNMRAYRTMAAASPVMEALGAVLLALIVAMSAREISRDRLKPEQAIAFLGSMMLLYGAVKKATTANNELQNTVAALRRSFELLDEGPAQTEPSGTIEVGPLKQGIVLADVSFAYGDTPVVRDFDLRISRGEVVALVGESGAGKTTVADLLVRFRDPTSGSITWDGIDLRDVPPRSLRAQVGLVTQDTVVLDDTALRNIAYGDPTPDRARAERAARAAHAHEFIAQLADGYDTPLGDRGHTLSGGQRQRIAIARALYKDAPVLVLDEATSALDSESEALVQAALAELVRHRTVVVIAHRLATVMAADRIVVMSEGRIVQQGTHAELMEQDGTYRRLHRLQAGA